MTVDSVFGQTKEAKNRFTVSSNAAGDSHQLVCCNFNQVIQKKRSEETEPVPNMVPKTAAADHVPEEMTEEIFSRMPVKSLVRFKSASQKWYSLLSEDYKFAKFHLKRSKKPRLVFFKVSSPNGTLFRSLNVDTNELRKFEFPVEIEVEVRGSANGLVCVAPYHKKRCFIWNPCTGKYKKIYVPVSRPSANVLGFGYDSCSDDFKIVANCNKHFRIFSLKTNSWKIIEVDYLMRDNAFHLNGALHWCLNEKIAAFDLAKEVFSYIELPDEMKWTNNRLPWHTVLITMWEYRGSLCISWERERAIWMLLNYGDSKSWVKLSASLAGSYQRPLGMSTLGEVWYQTRSGSGLVKSDIQGRMSNDDESLLNSVSRSGYSYMESLISPKCFDALHSSRRRQ